MVSSNKIRVADRIARRLARETRFAFGVPGGEVLTLIDALGQAGVRFIVARHETGAGFMAEGAQRVGGGVGVLVATLGPGVANTVNVVAHAQQARRPMIVLTGCVDPADTATYTHQVFDHQRVLGPLVKASFQIAAATVAETIERAVQIATEGVPGPVHIDVPVSVADVEVHDFDPPIHAVARSTAHAEDAVFRAAREALAGARRPLCIAGLGVLRGGAAEVLSDIIGRYPMPVLTTYEAKGVVDEHDSLCLGGFGLSPRADAVVLPFVEKADVVLLAGYDPVEVRHAWRHPFDDDATVIEVTRQLGQHGMHFPTCSLVGEPAAVLQGLFDGLGRDSAWGEDGEIQTARLELQGAFAPDESWGPSSIFALLEGLLDAETHVAVDTGAHRILLCQQWRFRQPGRLIQSNGTSTMACALPFSIGAKVAAPDTPTVCIVGDGGFEMGLGELGTLRDLGLPVVVIVLDDSSLSLIEKKQRARGLANVGVDFGASTDYAAIGRAFGGAGVRVESTEDLEREVKLGLQRDHFTVLHCPIPRRAYDKKI